MVDGGVSLQSDYTWRIRSRRDSSVLQNMTYQLDCEYCELPMTPESGPLIFMCNGPRLPSFSISECDGLRRSVYG